MAIRLLSSESINGALTLTGNLTGTSATFAGIITANSSVSGDYVRMYGASGTGQWDIYGNGANLRISDNQGAGILAVDRGATFGGTIKIGSGSLTNPSTNADDIVIDNGAGVETGMTFASSVASSIRFGQFVNNSIGSIEYIHTGNHLRFITNGTERVRITGVGNVGIGISPPADHKLQIHNPGESYARFALTNSNTGSASGDGLIFQMETLNSIIKNQEAGYLTFGTSGRETDLHIKSTGEVGIGSTGFTSQMLTIAAGNRDGAIYATSTDANCFASFRDSSSTANIGYGAIGNNHVFRKDASQQMLIDSGGSIIIGDGATSGTPAADYRSLEIGRQGNTITGAPWKSNLYFSTNATITAGSTAFTYRYLNELPTKMIMEDGFWTFSNAVAPTTVGTTISFTERMKIAADGFGYFYNNFYLASASNQGNLFFGTADNQYNIFGGGTYGYMGYNTGGYHRFLVNGSNRLQLEDSEFKVYSTAGLQVLRLTPDYVQTGRMPIKYPYYRIDSFKSDGSGYFWAFGHEKSDGTQSIGMMLNDGVSGNKYTRIINTLQIASFASNEYNGAYPSFTTNVVLRNSGISYLNGGNVGIGVTSPQARLQTNLTITGSLLAYLNGTSATFDAQANIAVVHNSPSIGSATAAGLVLANNDKSDGAPSPIIAFSAKSASNSFNHTYAAIYGVRTATGADTNWTKGDIVLATGSGTGPNERMRITSRGQIYNAASVAATKNTFYGKTAGYSLSTGSSNTMFGSEAGASVASGSANTLVGSLAGQYTTGNYNTCIGSSAGSKPNMTGSNHTMLGYTAGDEITTGTNCIAIGFAAGSGSSPRQMTTNSNEIVIGSNAIVGAYVRVAWTTGSDKRDKINFSNVPHGLDFVNKLKPTSYSLRKERDSDEIIGKRKYGFLAQEILELEGENPVIIDNSDENKLALQDSNLIPILVNAIQELKAEIEILKSK